MQLSVCQYVEVSGADAGCKDWLAPVALDCGIGMDWSLVKCQYPGKSG